MVKETCIFFREILLFHIDILILIARLKKKRKTERERISLVFKKEHGF